MRFIEGRVVDCIEGSLDRPGQGRAMDVLKAQRHQASGIRHSGTGLFGLIVLDAAAGST